MSGLAHAAGTRAERGAFRRSRRLHEKRQESETGKVEGKAMSEKRKSVIITFKAKEKRSDKGADKVDIVRSVLPKGMQTYFFDATSLASGASVPAMDEDLIAYDVNQYESPIVTARLTKAEIEELSKNGNVAEVEEDQACYAIGSQFGHLQFENQPSILAETVPAGVVQIKAPQGWPSSQGEGIRVAVVDTGIDYNHSDLKANYRGGVSFVAGASTPMDDHGHGTHCAGTVAAAINGAGVVGVAPSAYLYAVKVLNSSGSGSYSQIISGIDWCIQNGMRVVSMSLGGSGGSTALQNICNTAWSKGLLVVAAAGNTGASVGYPAKYKNVIAVSAIDSANALASFSSRGPEVDICAPGVNVLSTTRGGAYGTMSGTSMACPHVAGAAAAVWGAHRFASNEQIWNLLAYYVDNLGAPGWDASFGYGRVNVDRAALALTPAPVIAKKGI
ncbi:MAG: peptidase S8 [Candidatus Accumulibacter meliphilus]|uniref:Peptidase S8 n=1 Tax=Candidatus Accumulibacter meliphilus TaxID=2211374 RepID=A0A369XI30_9PROT|nr:MAG: peptidase S8 [Candidatus Accumulibacter meliphilus]